MQSLGIELKLIPLHRFIPLRVFLSKADSEQVANISKAIERVLTVFGFEFSDEFPEITGSWFKKWFAKTKEVITEPELSERLEKIERAIEIKGLHKPQSEIDKNQAEAIATLIKALEVVPNATINCGSILLVKTNDEKNDFCIQARTLTQKEMVCLEKNQNILKSPHDVLEKLSKISNEQSDIEMQKTKDIFCQIIYYIMKRTKKLKKIILAMKVQTVNHHVIH
jgi:hypothetical protein